MGLLGGGAVAVTLALLVLAVLGGSLLQARIHHLWLRLLATSLSCVLAVVGIAVELNRENGWYATVGDLSGDQAAAPLDAQPVLVRPGGHHGHGLPLPPLPHPGERLQSYLVTGPSGITNRVLVLLPTGYQDPSHARRDYPVLFLGHGMPGSVFQWTQPMDIRRTMDPLVAQGRFGQAIVVMPQLTLPDGSDTECIYGPKGGDQMERWLASDVPDFVTQHFRARRTPDAWAAMGFSAGAWCSSMLAMLHPDRFGAAISLGGYFRPEWVGTPPFGPGSAAARRLDLVRLAGHRPPGVALFLQSTRQDQESGPKTQAFADAVRAPLQATLVMDPVGGHRTAVWIAHVPQALQWLAKVRPAFA